MDPRTRQLKRAQAIGAAAGFVSVVLVILVIGNWDGISDWGGVGAAVVALSLALAPAVVVLWSAWPPRVRFEEGSEAEAEAAYGRWAVQDDEGRRDEGG